ncbi:MAG: hypothetical protein CM15mP111_2390 [Hyphomicrobiales bacterium]|nr:MAG: hypothetical protein CM15mP111_2390 [Hyphomicrobiales bacterium]
MTLVLKLMQLDKAAGYILCKMGRQIRFDFAMREVTRLLDEKNTNCRKNARFVCALCLFIQMANIFFRGKVEGE